MMKLLNRYRGVLTAITLLGILWLGAGAVAQTNTIKITPTETVILMFYKLTGELPNFEKWITSTAPYNLTPLARRPETYDKELVRLTTAYKNINLEKDLINVKAAAVASVNEYKDPDTPDQSVFKIDISFAAGDVDFFPYDFLENHFAVVPANLADVLHAQIPKEQFEFLQQQLVNSSNQATMILQLKPERADTQNMYTIDDQKYWALLTQVASVTLWNSSGAMLWEYTAPWYITPMHKSLLDLYEDKNTAPQAP